MVIKKKKTFWHIIRIIFCKVDAKLLNEIFKLIKEILIMVMIWSVCSFPCRILPLSEFRHFDSDYIFRRSFFAARCPSCQHKFKVENWWPVRGKVPSGIIWDYKRNVHLNSKHKWHGLPYNLIKMIQLNWLIGKQKMQNLWN